MCTLLQNAIISANEFNVVQQDKLSNFFLSFNADNNERSIRNSNNATIGKIASDGLSFDFDSEGVIERALICIQGDVSSIDTNKYSVADVGLG